MWSHSPVEQKDMQELQLKQVVKKQVRHYQVSQMPKMPLRFPNILDGRLSEFYSIEIKNMKLLNLFNLSMEDSLDLRFDQEEEVLLVEQIWPRTCLASLVLEITS